MESIGLYIHIPFCKSKCIYCDFVSSVCRTEKIDEYISYLCKEICLVAKKLEGKFVVDTIYIGGGTPSILSLPQLRKVVEEVFFAFPCDIKEFTMEANPACFDLTKVDEYKQLGITRISLGVQTLNDDILRRIGRLHTSNDAIETIKALEGKFDISVDCMLGLPSQQKYDVIDFLKKMTAFDIGHISCYTLSIEKGTQLEKLVDSGKMILPDENKTVEMYDTAYAFLKNKGYARYEISNFAKINKESKHNLKYWQMENYLGVGIGAHSFIGDKRFYNAAEKPSYYLSLDKEELPYHLEEKLSLDDKIEETIMLALRLECGMNIPKFNTAFEIDFETVYAKAIAKNKEYIIYDGKSIKIKEDYMCVMNTIITDFI